MDRLPGGEYDAHDDVVDALGPDEPEPLTGVPAENLTHDELLRELESLHRTRHDAFLHASGQALERHTERTVELELEYLRRAPERDVDPARLRPPDQPT